MNNKVSVLVPIYNVEPYLKRCIESILSQTYRNFEIILINDGSTDKCPSIIDYFAEIDDRVIPVHQKNGGYGKALNRGLELAQGEFISIVESDDWVSSRMYETLVDIAVREPVDYVKSNFFEVRGVPVKSQHMEGWFFKERVICPRDFLFELMSSPAAIWANLYRKEFLIKNRFRFLETANISYQDIPFHFQLNTLANNTYISDIPLYYYNLDNPNQSMKKKRNVRDRFIIYDHITSFIESNPILQERNILEVKWSHEFFMYKRNFDAVDFDLKRFAYQEMKSRLFEMEVKGLMYERFSPELRIRVFCVKNFPFLVYFFCDFLFRILRLYPVFQRAKHIHNALKSISLPRKRISIK